MIWVAHLYRAWPLLLLQLSPCSGRTGNMPDLLGQVILIGITLFICNTSTGGTTRADHLCSEMCLQKQNRLKIYSFDQAWDLIIQTSCLKMLSSHFRKAFLAEM